METLAIIGYVVSTVIYLIFHHLANWSIRNHNDVDGNVGIFIATISLLIIFTALWGSLTYQIIIIF